MVKCEGGCYMSPREKRYGSSCAIENIKTIIGWVLHTPLWINTELKLKDTFNHYNSCKIIWRTSNM